MTSVLPKLKPSKSLQIQFKEPKQRCTVNSLTNTLKKYMPNIKDIKITSKKGPRKVVNKKIHLTQKADKKDVEYYPDKLKRKVDLKKIVLEPRHEYKVVAATNKRKRCTPVKDAGSLKKLKMDDSSPEVSSNEVSFEDMIPSSIIHKTKDLKNTNSYLKNKLITASDLKISPKTATYLENGSKTVSKLKNGSKTASKLKSTPITASYPKTMPQSAFRGNQKLQTNLKSDSTPLELKPDSDTQMEEIEDLMNDESLTDEDFMEILTCPSPVWWEDPPDENYVDEPIGRFLNQDNLPQNQDCTKVPSETAHPGGITQNRHKKQIDSFNITKNGFGNKKLIEKRLKLENLLSSLKNNFVKTDKTKKNNGKVRKISSDGSELSVDDEDLVKSLQSIEIPIQKQNFDDIHKENKVLDEKNDVKTKFNDVKDVNNISTTKTEEVDVKTNLVAVQDVNEKSVAETRVNKSNKDKTSNYNEIRVNETVNKTNNDEVSIKTTLNTDKNTKSDTKILSETVTALNSPSTEKKATSPRKSNRISPKKHKLTRYYNLKSKRPRIIKQNPRNQIIIENHSKTNINFQKTPEKNLNKQPTNVSKIKKAYLDLLQQSRIEKKLVPNLETNKTSDEEEKQENTENNEKNTKQNAVNTTETVEKNTKQNLINTTETVEKNTKQNVVNTTETVKKENLKIETTENIKSETISDNNNHENNIKNNKNSKQINNVPLILPKLIKIPQNLAIQSPKSIKSGTSDSTDVNSEMDTISDTNIQFIDEYEEKKDEFVTVYQIISKNV